MTTRVAKTAAATLTHTFYVGETATDSSATVTYAVTDANGTAVTSGNATSAGAGTGRYTFTLTAQAALKRLTVAWTGTFGGVAVVETDRVEVVGGFFFSLAQGRACDASLADTAKYTLDDLTAARLEVEEECETICDRTFVPRYDRVVLDGTGTAELVLRHSSPVRTPADVRTLRRVSLAPAVDETFVDFTAAELAAVAVTGDGRLLRTDGAVFTEGNANVVVEYELGLDAPPGDLVRAALLRLRSRLNLHRTGVPDRALSFSAADGGTYRIDLPAAFKTGIPDVDAVYGRYSRRAGAGPGAGGRPVPASRPLNYDPQHTSLFHGGVR